MASIRPLRPQVVGGLGLLAGGQLVPLGAHVLNLGQLQGAVLLGLGEGQARVVGVDVDLKLLVPSPMTRLSPMVSSQARYSSRGLPRCGGR